jgi:hypothetical protein
MREGVYLPPKKAGIFDTIAHNPGISAERIIAKCFDGKATANTVRQHVYQINGMLAGTDIQISGDGIGARGSYRIVRLQARGVS